MASELLFLLLQMYVSMSCGSVSLFVGGLGVLEDGLLIAACPEMQELFMVPLGKSCPEALGVVLVYSVHGEVQLCLVFLLLLLCEGVVVWCG